jgi:periplasmic protein TonB
MFEDSLVESAGRIRTRAQRYAAGSLVLQATVAAIVLLIPYLYPDALPRKFLSVPLIAPPPPAAAPIVEQQHAVSTPATRSGLLETTIVAPIRIHHGIPTIVDQAPPGMVAGNELGIAGSSSLSSGALGPATPAPVIHATKPTGPIHISDGVAAGQLIVPIQPRYPEIARQAHIQGAVVVAAIIDTAGRVRSPRVLSGPPMLVNAAVEAIQQARYRPWKLNGEPVEVETTINVVFTLGSN